jgi:hypothetical protein
MMNVFDRKGYALDPGDEIVWASKSCGKPVLKRGIFLGVECSSAGNWFRNKMIATVWRRGNRDKSYKGYARAPYTGTDDEKLILDFVEKIL